MSGPFGVLVTVGMFPVGCWAYTFPIGRLERTSMLINPAIPPAINSFIQPLPDLSGDFMVVQALLPRLSDAGKR